MNESNGYGGAMHIVGVSGQLGSGKDTVADRFVETHGYTKVALADPLKRFCHQIFRFTEAQLWGPSENRNTLDTRYDHYCRLRTANGKLFGPSTNLSLLSDCDAGWMGAAKNLQQYGDTWMQEVLPGGDVSTLYAWLSALGSLYPRISPRIALQHLGTEWGRYLDEDIWVNCALRNAEAILCGAPYNARTGVGVPGVGISAGVIVPDVRYSNELARVKRVGGKLIRVHRKATDAFAHTVGIKAHSSETAQQDFAEGAFDVILHNNKSIDELCRNVDKIVEML